MTAIASDRYSRLISWLKVLFPLTALGLLSTLFLLSRDIDPEGQIPFADKEIQDRLRDQQVTGPFFSGTTTDGDQISLSAERLITPQGTNTANEALDIRAELQTASGTVTTLSAARARIDMGADVAELSGDVTLETSNGFVLRSDRFISALTSLSIEAPGSVTGTSPSGQLSAGAMTLGRGENGENTQLVFTNGVKLIYTPQEVKE